MSGKINQGNQACMNEERLACYVDELLAPAARQVASLHLEACEPCLERVIMARWVDGQEAALAGAAFPVTVAERAARSRAKALFVEASRPLLAGVFRLVSEALELVESVGAQWSMVALPTVRRGADDRAGSDLWETTLELGDALLRVEVERSDRGAVVSAGAEGRAGEAVLQSYSLALLRDGATVALQSATSEPADLGPVGPGRYAVELRLDGETLGSISLRFVD